MGNSQIMPKVDFEKEELKTAKVYSKYFEARNFERALIAKAAVRRKRIIFSTTVLVAVGIYSYTIIKIKQESFLDDFEEPELVPK